MLRILCWLVASHLAVAIALGTTSASGMPSDLACNDKAKSLLDESLEIAKRLPDDDPGNIDSVGHYYTLRPGYASLIGDLAVTYGKARCWSSALQALEAIRRPVPKIEAQVHLLQELVRQGELQAATDFKNTLHYSNISDRVEVEETIAFTLGKGFVLSGDIETGKEYFSSVTTRWTHRESPVYMFVQALLEAGRLDEAESYLSTLSRHDSHTRNSEMRLIFHLVERGSARAAKERLQTILSSEAAPFYSPSGVVLVYAMLGDVTNAIQHAELIEDQTERAKNLAWIAESAPRDADVRPALTGAVDAMASCVGDGCDNIWLLVSKAHADVGQEVQAIRLINQHIQDDNWRVFALSRVAVSLAKRGDIARALDVDPNAQGYRNEVQVSLAVAYARIGEFQLSHQAFVSVDNDYIKYISAAAVAALPLPSEDIPAWLKHADGMSESMRAGVYQVMMSALARRAESRLGRPLIEGEKASLALARSLLGLAQGELGIVTGEDWFKLQGIF